MEWNGLIGLDAYLGSCQKDVVSTMDVSLLAIGLVSAFSPLVESAVPEYPVRSLLSLDLE